LGAHVRSHARSTKNLSHIRAHHCEICGYYFLGQQWNSHLASKYHSERLHQEDDEQPPDTEDYGDFGDTVDDDIYQELIAFPTTYGYFRQTPAERQTAPEDDPRHNTKGTLRVILTSQPAVAVASSQIPTLPVMTVVGSID
jgi:hypothetical protein